MEHKISPPDYNKKLNINKKSLLITLALCWLVFVTAFFSGMYVYAQKKWPYTVVQDLWRFVEGEEAEKLTLADKVQNDLDIKPIRHIVTSTQSLEKFSTLKGLPIKSRRKDPKIFLASDAPEGFRVIMGTFDFHKSYHGVVLLDSDGSIKNIWKISQEDVKWKHRPDSNVFPHGFEIASDGSIIVAFDKGTSLTRYSYDGTIIWRRKGAYRHTIAFENDDAIWTLRTGARGSKNSTNLVKLDFHTGKVVNEFSLIEVMDANPEIDIFGIRQLDNANDSSWIHKGGGRWHANDIEPLPKSFVKHFRGMSAGDLLVSLRSPNLVFIMDPHSLKVKWWSQGLVRRQHDPDWNPDGTITIFNNNMHRGYSSIVEITPETNVFTTLVQGKEYKFYTWMRGKHQRLPSGGTLITSSQQGRVFEINKEGRITFEFLNYYGDENQFAVLSEARFLPMDFFDRELE